MTKRVGNFSENYNKKFKLDNDLNQLWGEDLDADDVEDCFLLASQVCEQDDVSCTQRNNVSILKPQNVFNEESYLCVENDNSILPSYDALKFNERNLVASTQILTQTNSKINVPSNSAFKFPCNASTKCNEFIEPTQSGNLSLNRQLQIKIESLQKDCVTKEGEASILRSQLKKTQKTLETEQSKKEQIWTDKWNAAQKELEATRSDLKFKNLEIANLKSKIIEITKHFNSEIAINAEQHKKSDRNNGNIKNHKRKSDLLVNQYKIEFILEYETLMTAVIFSAMFNLIKPVTYSTSLKNNDECSQYLETLSVSELQKISENKNFNLSCVYADISALIRCTTIEIDSEKYYPNINRILCITRLVIQNFLDYLRILENNTQNEDIKQLDNLYLNRIFNPANLTLSLFDSKEWCEKEMGIKSRQMITVLSEILPFSSHLQHHLLENKSLVNKADNDMFRYPPNNAAEKFDFLHLIWATLKIIGNIRKADRCVGFFSAVTLLLTNIYLSPSLNNCSSLVLSITRELVFARPSKEVIKYLSRFFKTVSSNETFVFDLCKMPVQRSLKIRSKEGILSFNEDSCILQVYTTLYEDNFINRYKSTDLDINLNTLQFITNLLQSETLQLNFQETNYCDCILKINNLCMEIICEVLRICRNVSTRETSKCRAIIQYSLRILNILSFKITYLITVKPVYKYIVETLLNFSDKYDIKDTNMEILENLNIKDVSNISASSFESIPFWK